MSFSGIDSSIGEVDSIGPDSGEDSGGLAVESASVEAARRGFGLVGSSAASEVGVEGEFFMMGKIGT